MALFKKRKNKDEKTNKDMSVIMDVAEPFSFQKFVDEKIVGAFNSFKKKLTQQGLVYFVQSPFQMRNRMLLLIFFIIIGSFGGLLPRSVTLINQIRENNTKSEISGIINKIYLNGNITVKPLSSSYYNKQHVLVFNIEGDTKAGVPSIDSGFNVRLEPLRSVTDEGNVKYRYKIIPLDSSNRLLVLYVDNRNQNDIAGIFGLNVAVKDTKYMDAPIELNLTNNQATTDLFKDNKINLAAISNDLTTSNKTEKVIEKAKKELDDALTVYKLNEERLNASDIKLTKTYEDMKKYVEKSLILKNVEDDSLVNVVDKKVKEIQPITEIDVGLIIDGKKYTTKDYQKEASKDQSTGAKELPALLQSANDIVSHINTLNQLRFAKYNELYDYSRILNKELSVDDFSEEKKVEIVSGESKS